MLSYVMWLVMRLYSLLSWWNMLMGVSMFLFTSVPGSESGLQWKDGLSLFVYMYIGWPVISDSEQISGLLPHDVGPFFLMRAW